MNIWNYYIDEERTAELNIPEVLVVAGKGDRDHFYGVLKRNRNYRRCPRCGSVESRNQGNFQRSFLDAIPRDDDAVVITVTVEYRKSKCMSPECGCVYYQDIPFAVPYARTTRRLDDAIVRMVLRGGLSYTESTKLLEDKISRQVVGQIYHRRLRELEADTDEGSIWFRKELNTDWFFQINYQKIRMFRPQ